MTVIPLNVRSESDQKAVLGQLDRVLKSEQFSQSRRRQRFLQYIVNETLAGRGDRLKGYTIAIAVFDRPQSFDPVVDPIVRIEAARLREKLREYYETGGRGDPIRIDLRKGSYAPLIEVRKAPDEPAGGSESAGTPEPEFKSAAGRWRPALAGVALIGLLGAGAFWLHDSASQARRDEAHQGVADVATVPAIGVLPFANLSGDAKQDYFSDGLTEDILTELARSRDIRVIARNTTFQYKGQAVDAAKLGGELGTRYLLEGSVQRRGDQLRVTAQLIDTRTGSHLWADRYDRDLAELFQVQDEIVNRIVAKIAGSYGVIERNETKAALRKSPEQLRAYDHTLRARDIMQWDWTAENFTAARSELQQAIELDPDNAQARRELASLAVKGWIFQLDPSPMPAQKIVEQASKAIAIDPTDARTRLVAASAYFFTKQLEQFQREASQALALAPYDAEIIATLACMISAAGDHERGIALAEKANALDADAATGWYHSTVYTADYLEGNYAHALEIARQAQDPEMFYSYLEIIPIYGKLGLKKEAAEAWRKLQEHMPGASASTFSDWWRLWNISEGEIGKLMDGVRQSGVLGEGAAAGG